LFSSRWKYFSLGCLVSLMLFWLPYGFYTDWFLEPPYKDVKLLDITETKTKYRVRATFIKTACTFERLEVIGYTLGHPEPLVWYDTGGVKPKGDRTKGDHLLDIKVKKPDTTIDSLEIRTRHICQGDRIVDKVFLRKSFT
jgi:hypothetical protein